MRFGVVRFPGTCDEVDAYLAASRVGDAEILWHADADLKGVDAVADFAREGGPVLGICNGFQVLCEAHLLPGALLPNTSLRFLCRQVAIDVINHDTPWTRAVEPGGKPLSIPVKHTTGRWYAPDDLLERVEANGQVVFRYHAGHNPNGSLRDVAGVCNEQGNVVGLMPHPEHAVNPLSGSVDGGLLFESAARVLTPA